MLDISKQFAIANIPQNHATAFFFGMARTWYAWDEALILECLQWVTGGRRPPYLTTEQGITTESLWRTSNEAHRAVI